MLHAFTSQRLILWRAHYAHCPRSLDRPHKERLVAIASQETPQRKNSEALDLPASLTGVLTRAAGEAEAENSN